MGQGWGSKGQQVGVPTLGPVMDQTMQGRPDVEYPARVVEPLGRPLVSHSQATGAASAVVTLSAGCRRITMRAVGAAARFVIGPTPTAVATSHFIAADERLDFAVRAGDQIAVRQDSAPGTLEISELGFS